MMNVYAPDPEQLPEIIPIFPLSGALLLPFGHLPLNIFEPRYLAMVESALAGSRIIGMVLPRQKPDGSTSERVYDVGCAGKIIEFSETPDGRYIIALHGISRFKIKHELESHEGFRRVQVCWDDFKKDLNRQTCQGLDRSHLRELLKHYFQKKDLSCDWQAIDDIADAELITCLSMICPFPTKEKQALLEARCCSSRAELFTTLLEIAICGSPCSDH